MSTTPTTPTAVAPTKPANIVMPPSLEVYKPSYTTLQSREMVSFSKIKLGLMGPSGSGKSFGAMTFPNPVVIDLDGNLPVFTDKPNAVILPFYDIKFCADVMKKAETAVNIRDTVLWFLQNEAKKLSMSNTLILDGWTRLQDFFDIQTDKEPVRTDKGNIDEFAFWARKLDYSRDILMALDALKCHVVVTFHEQDNRDANGALIGKVEPLMQGKFQKKIGGYFTDFYRCIVNVEKDAANPKLIKGVSYQWQTKSTNEVVLKTRMLNASMFIEPHFNSIKYVDTIPRLINPAQDKVIEISAETKTA